ncbi:hypothetical protein GCM10008014_27780 [Paenibacillus silvae]|uniref:Uncharacterized protein n=1 Tax=Paenibacillus silvae TaxID=1325358 RepID=A0ABQ1ZEH7_9BACL|nr:hypothetical protein GCM10008014_27780 [Paenibacillus silvae]
MLDSMQLSILLHNRIDCMKRQGEQGRKLKQQNGLNGWSARACLKTLKEADFAEFSFQARKFSAGVPGHVKGK